MASANVEIRSHPPEEVRALAEALGEILLDCVAGGASVSFMADLTAQRAADFWRGAAEAGDGRVVLVAHDERGPCGVVQLVPAGEPNQPHRADVAKLLVHRRARGRGVGEALMRRIEAEARAIGRTVLVLDTIEGEAGERLYTRLGWARVGAIPNYALMPDGRPAPTVVFYKELAA